MRDLTRTINDAWSPYAIAPPTSTQTRAPAMIDHELHARHATSGRITLHAYPGQEHYVIRDHGGHSAVTIPGGTRHGLTDDDITALEGLWEAQALDTLQTPTAPWQVIAHWLAGRGHVGQYLGLRDMGRRARLELAGGAVLTVDRDTDGYTVAFQTVDGETISEKSDTSYHAPDAIRMITAGHHVTYRRPRLIDLIQTRAADIGIIVTRESDMALSSPAGGITILPPDEDGLPGIGQTWDGASVRSYSDWNLTVTALDTLFH